MSGRTKERILPMYFEKNLDEGGLLNPILRRVKKDATLCLEIREKYVNIYYRGGNIIRIKKGKKYYIAHFEKKYCKYGRVKVIDDLLKHYSFLYSIKAVNAWVDAIPFLKQAMDFWFERHPKEEREFQQLIVRENNGSGIGNYTDYFIIDIEYDNHMGARSDLIAIEWESDKTIRKMPEGYKPKLSFIEMKYGDGAIGGKAGVIEHIKKFEEYVKKIGLKKIKDEMIGILKQKITLKLIPALIKNRHAEKIVEFEEKVDFIFLLANHDPEKTGLQKTLKGFEQIKIPGVEIKFCVSNFMGYGLYKENVISLTEFKERYARQILQKDKL